MTLLTVHTWSGEFFAPGDRDNRFFGEIEYSPEAGLVLTCRVFITKRLRLDGVIHGELLSGEQCTVLGPFQATETEERLGRQSRNLKITATFEFLLVGDLVAADEVYESASFSLSRMNDFFYAAGHSDREKYRKEPICTATASFGEIEFAYAATFISIFDIGDHVFSESAEAMEALQVAFEKVESEHPEAMFMLKKDITCGGRMVFSSPRSLQEASSWIADLSNLFALITYGPVFPLDIAVCKESGNGADISVYRSIYLDRRTVDAALSDVFHYHLPVKNSEVDLQEIVEKWVPVARNNPSTISRIQSGAMVRSEHSIHAEIVLLAVQLESISHAAGHVSDKYEYPLRKYAHEKIHDGLQAALGKHSLAENGIAIGELRNEIAHVGRPRKWLNRLSVREFAAIERCLQLTIIGHLLGAIGIPVECIGEYQYKHTP